MPRPTIACLMPLPPWAAAFAADATRDFLAQSYSGRTLVAVGDPAALAAVAAVAADPAVPSHGVLGVLTAPGTGDEAALLEAARGLAAPAELACVWRGDQRHHPDRLAAQGRALAGAGACCLGDRLLHFRALGRLVWALGWRAPGSGALPTTLLGPRAQLRFDGPAPGAAGAYAALRARAGVAVVAGSALCVQRCHRDAEEGLDGLYDEAHRRGCGLVALGRDRAALEDALAGYVGPGEAVDVAAPDGRVAFRSALGGPV